MKEVRRIINAFSESRSTIAPPDDHQKENEILHSVLNSLSEGVIVADRNGRFLYFNNSARRILGIGSRDIGIGDWTSVYGCFYPDRITPFPPDELPLAKAIRNEEVQDEVIFIKNGQRPDGVYIHVSASPLTDDSGRIQGGTVVFSDITQRKLAEISHMNSEARVSAQFRGIPIPTYVWQKSDNDFVLIDYNKAAENITHNRISRYLGRTAHDMYAHAPEIHDWFHECMHGNSETLSREMSYQMISTGDKKEMIVHFVRIPPDLVMVHTVDVTDIKKNEQELRKLSNAVEQTADSVVITDENGIIEYVNPAFEKTTGYTEKEILGLNMSVLKSGQHDRTFYSHLWKTISGGQPYNGLIVNRKKDGTLYWSEQTITPMKDETGRIRHYVSVLRDITETRKQQEQALQIELARKVQGQLYKNDLSFPEFEITGTSIPAAETNGDYYDTLRMHDGTYSVVIGDVSGHGMSSALIMAQTRAYLHAFARHESDPGILLTWLNRELVRDLDETHFVTLVMVRIDIENHHMVYASAGHVPGFVLNQEGGIRKELSSTGIPLGFIREYTYEKSGPVRLEPNDLIILLTDGIVEAHDRDENEFGLKNVLGVVAKNRRKRIRDMQKQLHDAVLDFSSAEAQEDDITSVICRFRPGKIKRASVPESSHSADAAG
ncbi:SpoIIE family protein phosphatase [bacterium]|nr:SpoIIE family protein phosphatase [bacterium]